MLYPHTVHGIWFTLSLSMPSNTGPLVTTTKTTVPTLTRLQPLATMPSPLPIQTPAFLFNAPSLSPSLMLGLLKLSASNRVLLPFRAPKSLRDGLSIFCIFFLAVKLRGLVSSIIPNPFRPSLMTLTVRTTLSLRNLFMSSNTFLLARPLVLMACLQAFSSYAQKRLRSSVYLSSAVHLPPALNPSSSKEES